MKIMTFELAHDEGTVTVQAGPTLSFARMVYLFARPLAEFKFWHICGCHMVLQRLTSLNTVLYCQHCGARQSMALPDKPTLYHLYTWATNRTVQPTLAEGITLTQGEYTTYAYAH